MLVGLKRPLRKDNVRKDKNTKVIMLHLHCFEFYQQAPALIIIGGTRDAGLAT